MMNAELMRLIENLIRVGVVAEVDAAGVSVRVRSGELLTGWLRWQTQRAGEFKIWCAPAEGEQVLLCCMGGNPETAFILGSLYSNANPAPASNLKHLVITAPDGAVFAYDAEASALTASGIKTATVTAAVKITLDTPEVECTNLLTTKTLAVAQGGTLSGTVTHTGGLMSSNGVVVSTHRHGGVQSGNSTSGMPQ